LVQNHQNSGRKILLWLSVT